MAIDPYAACPCGNGKKIKFCRCRDSLAGNEDVFRLMEGGQLVAALDRVNQLIEKEPTAAWLYAVKGRILIDVEDTGPLRENAERFLRLQPDNPLALAQRAAVHVTDGQLQEAADCLVNALAESKEGVDPLLLDVSGILAVALIQQGNILSSRMFASIPLSAKGYERPEIVAALLSQLDRDSSLNLLLKQLPTSDELGSRQTTSERLAEALRLLHAQRVTQAQDKLRQLERQSPQEPTILMALAECSVWRCDQSEQVKWLRKLSEAASLPLEQRAEFLARGALLDVQPHGLLTSPAQELSWELSQVDGLLERMALDPCCLPIPDAYARQFVSDDEVPPRAAFQLLDGPLIKREAELPSGAETPRVLTNVAIFGRQTDRAPLLVAQAVLQSDAQQIVAKIEQLIGGDGVGAVKETPTAVALESQYSVVPPMLRVTSRADAIRLSQEMNEHQLADQLLDLPLQLFGGKSARQCAAQGELELQRTAFVRILEGAPEFGNRQAILAKIRQAIGVAELPEIPWSTAKQRPLTPMALNRVNPEDLQDPRELASLVQTANALRLSQLGRRAAERLRAIPIAPDFEPLLVSAYQLLAQQAPSLDVALQLIEEGKGRLARGSQPLAALLLMEIPYRLMSTNPNAAGEVINRLVREYEQDAAVMAQLQQLLVELGILRPTGEGLARKPAPGAAAEPSSSGLWTPESAMESPAARSPSPAPSPASGGKLWLPGMD